MLLIYKLIAEIVKVLVFTDFYLLRVILGCVILKKMLNMVNLSIKVNTMLMLIR